MNNNESFKKSKSIKKGSQLEPIMEELRVGN